MKDEQKDPAQLRDDDIDLRSIISVLRRQLRRIVLTVIVILAVAILFLATATPQYTARTMILVDPSRNNLLESDQAAGTSAQADNARIESEVEILRSPSTALAVVDRGNLVLDPEFGPSVGFVEQIQTALGLAPADVPSREELLQGVLSRLQEATTVRRMGLTYLISVEVTSEDPRRAAEIANLTARTYIQRQVEGRIDASREAREILQRQIQQSLAAVAQSDRALDAFIDDSLASFSEEAGSPRLERLRAELSTVAQDLLVAEVVVNDTFGSLQQQNYAAVADRLGSEAINELARQRANIERQLSIAVLGTEDEINLRNALADIEAEIESSAESELDMLRSSVDELAAEERRLRSQLREELLSADLSSEALAQIFDLQQASSIARTQYQNLLSRLNDLETQANLQMADSRVVSEALPPRNPSFPNRNLVLALALVIGSGLGVALAFFREFYVGGITSVSQLRDVGRHLVATSVPFTQAKGDGALSPADLIIDEPLSSYSEAVRRLKAALDQGLRRKKAASPAAAPSGDAEKPAGRDGIVIMVTSTVPAEGKSTLALALARAYAYAGSRVALVDADLRRPSLHKLTANAPENGLLSFLKDPTADQEDGMACDDREEGLTLLLGSGFSTEPTDQLLSSKAFDHLVHGLKKVFDITIIDTPPVLPVVDARYIAHHADAIVMPVRYASTTQSDLRQALSYLSQSKRDEVDLYLVLSHHVTRHSGYYYSGEYYAYGPQSS